jgi:hypothetical protein
LELTRKLLALVVMTLLGLAACGNGGSGDSAKRPKVPRPLDTIEAEAEDIIDIVPGGQWDKVGTDVKAIEEAWSTYRSQALADGAAPAQVVTFDGALSRLKAAAETRKPAETMQAANDVSAVTVELYGLYDIGRPVEIGRLDVIGRQIVFEADRKDLAAAGRQVAEVDGIWKRGLRADIVDHDGKKVAEQTDANLAAMQKAEAAGDPATLRSLANEFLEIVDRMEDLY